MHGRRLAQEGGVGRIKEYSCYGEQIPAVEGAQLQGKRVPFSDDPHDPRKR